MAGIRTDPEIFEQARIRRCRRKHAGPERFHFGRGFQRAERFRFERDAHADPGPKLDAAQRLGRLEQARRRRSQIRIPRLETDRHGRERHIGSRLVEHRQQFRNRERVTQPLVGGPVGRVDLFLYARAVKVAERERVDGDGDQFMPPEKLPQIVEPIGLPGGALRDSQSHSEGTGDTQPRPQRQDVSLERREHVVHPLAGVHVHRVAKGDRLAGASLEKHHRSIA